MVGEAAFGKCFISHYEVWVLFKSYFGSEVEWWDRPKRDTWVLTVSYCSAKAQAGREGFIGLRHSLQTLVTAENKGEGGRKGRDRGCEEVRSHYFRELGIFCFGVGGSLLSLGRFVVHEIYSAYFFKQVKAARARVCILHLRGRDGGLISAPERMVGVASGFFGECAVDNIGTGRFLGGLEGRVPGVVVEDLERPVTMAEGKNAMRGLPDGKVPGIDQLPKEFYVVFWGILGRDFFDIVNSFLNGRLLGSTMKGGVLTLLYKKGDRDVLENYWRSLCSVRSTRSWPRFWRVGSGRLFLMLCMRIRHVTWREGGYSGI